MIVEIASVVVNEAKEVVTRVDQGQISEMPNRISYERLKKLEQDERIVYEKYPFVICC